MIYPHSPGPWQARHKHPGARAGSNELDYLGWEIDGPPAPVLRGQFAFAADAYLIAAAPELLAALMAIVNAVEDEDQPAFSQPVLTFADVALLAAAREAIAKARGEA